jgi:hypothetical protein
VHDPAHLDGASVDLHASAQSAHDDAQQATQSLEEDSPFLHRWLDGEIGSKSKVGTGLYRVKLRAGLVF